jgi:hypothetical protein
VGILGPASGPPRSSTLRAREDSRRRVPLAARPAPPTEVRAHLRVRAARGEQLAALSARPRLVLHPARNVVARVPFAPLPNRRVMTPAAPRRPGRPASSNSPETRPKEPFSRTSNSVLGPFQPSPQTPQPHRHGRNGCFTPLPTFFSRLGRTGCRECVALWQACLGGVGHASNRRDSQPHPLSTSGQNKPRLSKVFRCCGVLGPAGWKRDNSDDGPGLRRPERDAGRSFISVLLAGEHCHVGLSRSISACSSSVRRLRRGSRSKRLRLSCCSRSCSPLQRGVGGSSFVACR